MPEFKADQAALAGKAAVFMGMFTTFNEVTDPVTAVILSLVAFFALTVIR